MEVEMNDWSGCFACCAYCLSLSRSGPTVPFAFAAVRVWQAAQPLSLNTVRPATDGFGEPMALDWLFSHLSKAAGSITTAVVRMVAWPRPQSSWQMTGYVPSLSGVITSLVVIPGTMSCVSRNCGTKNEWMTSLDCMYSSTSRFFGSMRVDELSPFASG